MMKVLLMGEGFEYLIEPMKMEVSSVKDVHWASLTDETFGSLWQRMLVYYEERNRLSEVMSRVAGI